MSHTNDATCNVAMSLSGQDEKPDGEDEQHVLAEYSCIR
jgi:hypothetical protein